MRFEKHEGLGNDFVVVDVADLPAGGLSSELARRLCDRHRGVGADGVLVVGRDAGAGLSMDVINADGSTSEMCGNGLRCVVRFAAAHGWLAGHATTTVRTGAGPLACTLLPGGEVEVDMGRPELSRARIPMAGEGDSLDVPLDVGARRVRVTCCALGNPHATTFDPIDAGERAALGPAIELHPVFPARVNVGFATALDRGAAIDLTVWERGVGFTQACGTGACAAAIAAVRTGRSAPDRPIVVHLPGGDLTITVAADLARVLMRGPARHVYSGDVELEALAASGERSR
ncbi:MAG: diaminopimelate epimerase [Deltaproteobacteria bacterium]|nr:diaminopimelate epimerase [Deltaproteobacteria bacterium]